jgi:hypothetical protein
LTSSLLAEAQKNTPVIAVLSTGFLKQHVVFETAGLELI